MFLDCPAYLDREGAVRCGLPAEVRCRFTMRSTDGPVESAMIRCPAGHYFCGAIESLTWDGKDNHDPGPAAVSYPAPGATASRAVMRAVWAGSPSGISRPSRSRKSPAPTPLRPTIWATLPACGSPSCVRAAGTPHPITRCEPSPAAGNRPHPGRMAPSPAPEPKPSACPLQPRRGRSRGCSDARLAPGSGSASRPRAGHRRIRDHRTAAGPGTGGRRSPGARHDQVRRRGPDGRGGRR